MATKVIDVSSYQPNINYAAVKKAGVSGAIIRSSLMYWGDQSMVKESCVDKHYQGFHDVGIPVGVYHYSCATTPEMAREEARLVLDIVKNKQLEYPIYYDTENNERQGPLSKAALTEVAIAFCEEIEKAGYYVGIYASLNWLENKLDLSRLEAYDKWVAQYHTECQFTGSYGMWQYTSQGKVDGISGNVDMNECYQDYPSIIRSAGLNHLDGIPDSTKPSNPTNPQPASKFKVGDKVKVLKAVQYDSGAAFTTYYDNYDVLEVSGNRVVIGIGSTVTAAVHADNLAKVGASVPAAAIKVGDKVRVKQGAKDYTGNSLASFVYQTVYTVQELSGKRAVIGLNGAVTAAISTDNLYKA